MAFAPSRICTTDEHRTLAARMCATRVSTQYRLHIESVGKLFRANLNHR